MKAIVTLELEIDEEILEKQGIAKDEFVKKYLTAEALPGNAVLLSHTNPDIAFDDDVFTSAKVVTALPIRWKKN